MLLVEPEVPTNLLLSSFDGAANLLFGSAFNYSLLADEADKKFRSDIDLDFCWLFVGVLWPLKRQFL